MGFFERLKDGLSKTGKNFTEKIETLVGLSTEVDEDFWKNWKWFSLPVMLVLKLQKKL